VTNCLPMDEVQSGYEFLACHMTQTMDSMGTGYMMRSKDYDSLGGMPQDLPNLIFADYILWIRLASINYKATSLKECFSYRLNNSVSRITNGEDYIKAFEKYVLFLQSLKEYHKFKEVIERYAHTLLMYYCQALSHRLLKMPKSKRVLTVKQYIENCRYYASLLIPEQKFDPLSKRRISIAQQLDNNLVGRQLFDIYQRIKRRSY